MLYTSSVYIVNLLTLPPYLSISLSLSLCLSLYFLSIFELNFLFNSSYFQFKVWDCTNSSYFVVINILITHLHSFQIKIINLLHNEITFNGFFFLKMLFFLSFRIACTVLWASKCNYFAPCTQFGLNFTNNLNESAFEYVFFSIRFDYLATACCPWAIKNWINPFEFRCTQIFKWIKHWRTHKHIWMYFKTKQNT